MAAGFLFESGVRSTRSRGSSMKPAAIVRLLEAEEAYRTARFGAALELYRQAVAEDSLFAFAALKGAQAASWINRLEEATDLVGVAKANENLLPPRYRPYLRGEVRPDAAQVKYAQVGKINLGLPAFRGNFFRIKCNKITGTSHIEFPRIILVDGAFDAAGLLHIR